MDAPDEDAPLLGDRARPVGIVEIDAPARRCMEDNVEAAIAVEIARNDGRLRVPAVRSRDGDRNPRATGAVAGGEGPAALVLHQCHANISDDECVDGAVAVEIAERAIGHETSGWVVAG